MSISNKSIEHCIKVLELVNQEFENNWKQMSIANTKRSKEDQEQFIKLSIALSSLKDLNKLLTK